MLNVSGVRGSNTTNTWDDATEFLINSSRLTFCFLALLVFFLCCKFCDLVVGPKHVSRLGPSIKAEALAALTSVFIPAQAAWMHQFQELFSRTSVDETTKQIHVNASQLFKNLVDGKLETRSTEDLSLLFQGKLFAYDWKIQLAFSLKWRVVILGWIFGQYMRIHKSRCLNDFADSSLTRIDLDCIAYGEKKHVINEILQLQPGDSVGFEFTSFADHIQWPDQTFIACAIPFLPGNVRICSQQHPERFSALLNNLPDCMNLLSQRGTSISNLTNVSAKRRKSLEKRAEDFAMNSEWRNAYIGHHNVTCWRATRLKLLWEAGLLASGLVTRWRLTITKGVQ